MNHHELELLSRRGEEVGRLLHCDAVREVIEEQLAARREAILNLKAADTAEFGRLKAGLEALEELVAALTCVVQAGDDARARLGGPSGSLATAGRVL